MQAPLELTTKVAFTLFGRPILIFKFARCYSHIFFKLTTEKNTSEYQCGFVYKYTLHRPEKVQKKFYKNFSLYYRLTRQVKVEISPVEYKNLRVRISGYSDYFVRLEYTIQDEIISRTVKS